MARRQPLFTGDSQFDQLMQIVHLLGRPIGWAEFDEAMPSETIVIPTNQPDFAGLFEGVDPLLIDLLKRLLEVNPSKRITALEALQHDYFNTIPPNLKTLCLEPFVNKE